MPMSYVELVDAIAALNWRGFVVGSNSSTHFNEAVCSSTYNTCPIYTHNSVSRHHAQLLSASPHSILRIFHQAILVLLAIPHP